MVKNFTLSLFLLFSFSGFSQVRYLDSVFNFVEHADVNYGSNYDSKNNLQQLLMDVYEPEGDTASIRPIIFFIHGGSFVGGSRGDQSINKTAEYFAQKGYVTANLEYRVEQTQILTPYLDFADAGNFHKAIARVTQDIKAAIRYFKKDAATNGNIYRVDTTTMFLYGSSAGAISSLFTAYLDDTVEMSQRFKVAYKALGGLEGNSGNPGYSIKGIKAVVSCSGAIDDVNYINNNTDIDYLGFHNNPDFVVPYDIGCFTTVFCHLGYFYGDNRVGMKTRSLNMRSEFHTIPKAGHPVDAADDTVTHTFILETMTRFLYPIVNRSVATAVHTRNMGEVRLFPNPSDGNFHLQLPADFQLPEAVVDISGLDGRILFSTRLNGYETDLHLDLPAGIYVLSVHNAGQSAISKITVLK